MRAEMKNVFKRSLTALFAVVLLLSGAGINAYAADDINRTQPGQTGEIIPVGKTVGIKLFMDGVLAVGFVDIETADKSVSPAQDGGMMKGDLITFANGEKITSAQMFEEIVKNSGGEKIELLLNRNGQTIKIYVRPTASNQDGAYRIGVLIKDSIAGIGTLTFFDPQTGKFGALGHGITDSDTGVLLPLGSGAIMRSTVTVVTKGSQGVPGHLSGEFDLSGDIGLLYANTLCGIFGTADPENFYTLGNPVKIADKSEIHTGKANIIANINGEKVNSYEIEIAKIYGDTADGQRNMLIKVTDKNLLDATGGIVQGMSGSPIMQDGKIIGAVTHVLVNDPAFGYGIFIENMLKSAE